jgi:hypothetical protein
MSKPRTVTKEQILAAIRAAERKLGRAPSGSEFTRLSGITIKKVTRYYPSGFRAALRDAGITPSHIGFRVATAELLKDWGRVARKVGHVPAYKEYEEAGRFSGMTMRNRFQYWMRVHSAFVEYVQGSGLSRKWRDVLEMIRKGPIPAQCGLKMWPEEQQTQLHRAASPVAAPQVLPPQLWGKKRVTDTMLPILLEACGCGNLRESWGRFAMSAAFSRRVLPDRPVMGPPSPLDGMGHEPMNEMGVVYLFGMIARRLGFVVEVMQTGYPDCEAKLEVEPGRWQRVRIEFEYESRTFYLHRHDPEKCDFIVCWKHNWKGCPEKLQVLELREVVTRIVKTQNL